MYKYAVIFVALFFILSCSRQTTDIVAFQGPTMGTLFQVKYVKSPDLKDIDDDLLEKEVVALLVQVNQLMSTYIEDSELSLLNKAPANTAFALSDETALVLKEAIRLNAVTAEALDITVGPLVNLWGFGPQLRPEKIPSQDALEAVSEYIGINKFTLNGNVVTKSHDDVYIDLSTIAKGYGVDRLAELLESYNIVNYLVDIGGEMRLSGKKPNDQDWRIAIEKPITTERAIQRLVSVGDNAIATSGDYRNYFEEDGVRYSHLISPTSLQPVQHNLVAVTVVAPSSMTADGLATGLNVLGQEKGLKIANDNDIAALFIVKEGDEFIEYRSKAFDQTVTVLN